MPYSGARAMARRSRSSRSASLSDAAGEVREGTRLRNSAKYLPKPDAATLYGSRAGTPAALRNA